MSPAASMAALPIQRLTPSFGANVSPWTSLRAAPSGLWISYQRTPAWLLPALTVWLATSTSSVSMRRYCRRFISRSASGSSVCDVPRWAMQPVGKSWLQNAQVYWGTVRLVGPGDVVVAGVGKSGLNRHVRKLLPRPVDEEVSIPPMYSASPAGGTWVAL